MPASPGSLIKLVVHARGALSSLAVQPQPGQTGATLRVQSVGLNFRDVLNVLGMYPGDPGPPGGDCAGTMSAVGGVHCMDVLGLAHASLRSYAATDQRLLAAMPEVWSYEEASAMPTVWATAWMCLEELVGVASGEGVLVQAATGGVGLVATRCAHRAGGKVYVTVGRASKRAYLRCVVDVCMVSTTRDSAVFVSEIGAVLDGQLGAVLNSMTHGEYIQGAAAMLGEGGQFVEIGKRGIGSRSQMAHPSGRYAVVAMDRQCGLDQTLHQ